MGLRLKFSIEPDSGRAEARTVIAEHFNGWFGAVHGGIITTLLDETMVYACTSIGWMTVTGTIEVKFHRPVPRRSHSHHRRGGREPGKVHNRQGKDRAQR